MTAVRIRILFPIVLFSFALVACSAISAQEPRVRISSPDSGDSVASPIHVVMEAENFAVEAAGEIHEGAGHLHIMVDTDCLPAGEVVPKDDTHLHFGDGSTEADLELAPGEHTLCLQAADGAHFALPGAGMTHTIQVTVGQ